MESKQASEASSLAANDDLYVHRVVLDIRKQLRACQLQICLSDSIILNTSKRPASYKIVPFVPLLHKLTTPLSLPPTYSPTSRSPDSPHPSIGTIVIHPILIPHQDKTLPRAASPRSPYKHYTIYPGPLI
jgi:hypothetical protein